MTNFIKTHFKGYDEKLDGLRRGTVTLIQAYVGSGKTTFSLNMAYNVASIDNLKVCLVTLEELKSEVYGTLSILQGIKNPSQPTTMRNVRNNVEVIDYSDTGYDVDAENKFFNTLIKKDYDLIIIDTVDLLTEDEHSFVSKLREHCVINDCAAVILGNQSRAAYKRLENNGPLSRKEHVNIFWDTLKPRSSADLCSVVMSGTRCASEPNELILLLTPMYVRHKPLSNNDDIKVDLGEVPLYKCGVA